MGQVQCAAPYGENSPDMLYFGIASLCRAGGERAEKDEIDPEKTQHGHRRSDADHNPVFHRVCHRHEPEYPEYRFEQDLAAFRAILHG